VDQHPIVVGQAAYNEAYGTTFGGGLAGLGDPALTFDTLSGVALTLPLRGKGIEDRTGPVYDMEYGRMTTNLGLTAPTLLPTDVPNIVPFPYVNPTSEVLTGVELPPGVDLTPISTTSDGTQLWRIVHNGVDTHPVHFHLFDVQVISRVNWNGVIRPPEPNELGWKDTLRIAAGEATVVALRPIVARLPFGVPDSSRPLNPMRPLGATDGFTHLDATGSPIPAISNQVVNFGW